MKGQFFSHKVILLLALTACAQAVAEPALKDVFADDFLVGAALNEDQIYGKTPEETALIIKHYNTITPENILKWESVHPEMEKYNFDPADKFVELGEKNEMFLVGHTLVWHHQTPNWVFEEDNGNLLSRQQLLQRMKEHIDSVVGRYKGRIKGWDVVNEAIADDGSFRKSKWQQIIGDDYIEKAFQYAHEADPEAELYYNDYNMWQEKHREGVIRLIKNLQDKGVHIDGVGFQGHWGFDYPKLEELEKSIIACAKLGIKIDITELDMTILPNALDDRGADISKSRQLQARLNPYPDCLPAEIQQKQARRYADFFSAFHKHADKINRVTFWGVQDGNSWRNNWPVHGRTDHPLLFDRNCKPKPAFDAIMKTIRDNQ
ncbi:MAG: endo-1,4-beta-xylanase [Planctomycetota bacterium]|jgi:endo-1,4-beta-xylanase